MEVNYSGITIQHLYLERASCVLVIGFSRANFEASEHYFKRHFGASQVALTEAQLLKHDLPVHGLQLESTALRISVCLLLLE